MTIDAHQHFWRYTAAEFGWLDEPRRALRRDFLPADLAPTLAAHRIDGTIAVQARQSLDETNWLLALAREHRWIKGVVGWAPLADPRAAEILETLASDDRLKGVRHVVQAETDPAFLEAAAFNAGVTAVTACDLTYDLLIVARQLPATLAFVDRHPRQSFILDHIAKPDIATALPAEWRRHLVELARRENVACKFSGVVTEAPGFRWTAALLRPYFEIALEAFGPRRLMFGSDWPVCLAAADYARWHGFVAACAASLSPGERAGIFGDNAAQIYRLT